MRKFISCILIITLALSAATAFAAGSSLQMDEKVFRLKSLGIIDDFEADRKITRIEAVTAMVKMLVDSTPDFFEGDTGFSDVPSDYPGAGYVYYGRQLKLIAGVYDGIFLPMENITLAQMIKMAVITLGFGMPAEEAGGYPNGYIAIAVKYNLVKNLEGSYEDDVAMRDMVRLIDNMLSAYTLEPEYGTENYKISKNTLHEQITEWRNKTNVKGIVTAVGEIALNGERRLREKEISIDGVAFNYNGDNALKHLGKAIIAYYTAEDISQIISIHEQDINNEIIIDGKDIDRFLKTEITYQRSNYTTETLKIDGEASFIYNNGLYTPDDGEINIMSGEVRLLDNNNDGDYDIVFTSEYESFIIEKISSVNNTIYFQRGISFKEKSGFKFDFADKDKKYSVYDTEGNVMEFKDIQEGCVVTIHSDIEQKNNTIIISNETVEGEITEVTEENNEVKIDGVLYKLYKKADGSSEDYSVGEGGRFVLNNKNEIVGTDGRTYQKSSYGYVIGTDQGKGLLTGPKLMVVESGESEKSIEITGSEERIAYNYINAGEKKVLELADTIYYTGPDMENKGEIENHRLKAGSINMAVFHRAAITYTVDSKGKINRIQVTKIPVYETAKLANQFAYNFNGKLNSFGGYSSKDAFFIGENTNVICIPMNNAPMEDDYNVDITIRDDDTCTIIPIGIDMKTQIAESAVLIAEMDANTPKPFRETTKVSIVGRLAKGIDQDGEMIYKLEVLTGDKLETPFLKAGSISEDIASELRCGDLIRYNTKISGEIDNIEFIESMARLGNDYDISREGSEEEEVFAQAYSIALDRLDNYRNEMVDILKVSTGDREKEYTILRENSPTIYSYERKTGAIMMAEMDEIATFDDIGEGASQVYMFVNQNVPKVVVIIQN